MLASMRTPKAKSRHSSAHRRRGAKATALTSAAKHLSLDEYVATVERATPMQKIELERAGVPGRLIKDLSTRMKLPTSRMFGILGLPKATAEKKAAQGESVAGSAGYSAIGMAALLAKAQEMATDTAATEARFDAGAWLGRWIELPQPALGGRRPSELLDTATGVLVVSRLLGSLVSGSYQ
jgi:putative toxin-antitoxin system antitoxin component (TIGR02293 family)